VDLEHRLHQRVLVYLEHQQVLYHLVDLEHQ
jgi:hypothetical protein